MNDVFKEQMVKQATTMKANLVKAGAIVLTVIIFFVCFSIQSLQTFFPFILLAVGFGDYLLFGMFNCEFEYILTNGDLDVDVIYGKSRRKRVFTGDLKSVEIMCHVDDMGYEAVFKTAVVKKDCSDGKPSKNTYKFVAPCKGKMMAITFTPNDEMLKLMMPYLGQRRLSMKK